MAKYERIADSLRTAIRKGELAPGAKIPAEAELLARYHVSLPTLRQALSVLRGEGLIEARHGIGTYVRAPQQRVRRNPDRYQEEKNRARLPLKDRVGKGAVEDSTGLKFDDIDFNADFSTEPADEELATLFDVPPGTALLCRTYSARVKKEDKPLHLIHSYMLYEVAAQNDELLSDEKEPWPGGTQNQLYTIGIELEEISEYVTARPPTTAESELLDIGEGVSLIYIRKVSKDITGRAVEISDIYLPGDRTELVYTTRLKRWK